MQSLAAIHSLTQPSPQSFFFFFRFGTKIREREKTTTTAAQPIQTGSESSLLLRHTRSRIRGVRSDGLFRCTKFIYLFLWGAWVLVWFIGDPLVRELDG